MIGVIGSGGHAKVIMEILEEVHQKHNLTFFTLSPSNTLFGKYSLFEDSENTLLRWKSKVQGWHIAIGNPKIRKEKAELLNSKNLPFITAIHPKSVISKSAKIGLGSAVMAGTVINPQVTVGDNCIINTSTSIDHECVIGNYVNIGPGSHLAGNVTIGELSDLGAGTIVIPNVKIGESCIIGAGAVVISDIPDGSLAVGVPAKVISAKNN